MTDGLDGPGFDLGGGNETGDGGYVVLARKYRPESFVDLIGQDAMVQTLRNAFLTDRIAQGFMLTGVRGVGKTTTARILARALNYEKDVSGDQKPTVDFDGYGVHCRDIIKSNHPDILEMDAASNTGIDNIREIIESARYKPLLARYKVFIIDEVHMLSKGAFNALLKTLEEPPGHVKFIFATTEVRKVPVTVLSRCQRFDLRRVEVATLARHFRKVVEAENASAEDDALSLIARAAEGSVRDGLSILDQAIAMGAGSVTSDAVRKMIGLADRSRIFDLMTHVLSGQSKDALALFDQLYGDGADPVQLLRDLAETTHLVTKAKTAGVETLGDEFATTDKERAAALGQSASLAILSRAWQMLVKGLDEAARAPNAKSAAEMVLIRLTYTADLPTPDELMRALGGAPAIEGTQSTVGTANTGQTGATGAASTQPPPQALAATGGSKAATAVAPSAQSARLSGQQLATFDDVVAMIRDQRDAMLLMHLEDNVRLVAFEPGRIEINLLPAAPNNLAGDLGAKLTKWTGQRWIVTVSREQGAEPIGEVRRRREAAELAELKNHPAVKAVMAGFPNLEIETVKSIETLRDASASAGSEQTEIAGEDHAIGDDDADTN